MRRARDTKTAAGADDAEMLEEADNIDTADGATESDNYHRRAGDVFTYLSARADAFGSAYPYTLEGTTVLTLRDPSPHRSLYVFLLACASFRYVTGKHWQNGLAARFEGISVVALRRALPVEASVHLFGMNSELRNGRYSGKLVDKLKLLASDLGEKHQIDDEDFEDEDRGDHGLDVVAWLELGDKLGGRPIWLGQCACTPRWTVKQYSSSVAAMRGVMTFVAPPMNICFIPFDFRRPDGYWFKRAIIGESIVVDRRRMMHMLGAVGVGVRDDLSDLDYLVRPDQLAELRGLALSDL
ncbi:hypothetical protein ABC795_11855 [Blastococcus sp. HT6-30]|uniref:hypothetical protein n=1 Tax=Blastococcus sp. HT6-30 TaxID=3144843 RepID=UPI00321AF240